MSFMAEKLFLLCLFFLFLSNPISSQEFLFNGFNQLDNNISLDGVARIGKNGILQLTNDTLRVIGHSFYSSPIQFKNSTDGKAFSFSTAFAFAVVPEYPKLGGHGFAFAISSTKTLVGARPSQFLGLLNESDIQNSTTQIFAVEFDTVQDFEFGDINDNHVGIDINSLKSNKSVPAAYFDGSPNAKKNISLQSGQVIQAWIDYDSTINQITVRISPSSMKPMSPLLTFDVDLSSIFQESMYIGFSSSTGLLASSHYVFGWSFKINGEAKSLYLNALPSLPGPKKNHTALIVGVSISSVLVVILAMGFAIYIIKKIKNADVIEAWELDIGPHRFSYKELKIATRGFRDKELLGFGGFGRVYKGTLPNSNTQVAVKRISHESKQGLQEFVSEIASIGRLRHRNLVQLLGWCRRREDLLLVYDFMPNRSVDKYIYEDSETILSWEQRFKIIKGVASGLLYLHEEWEQAVIHRDIKAGNVLLDSEMNGRLGDFGLAKLYEHGSNPSTTRVVGTLGYLAPELTRTGKPTTGSDVFAFGALLLEVACGRRPIEAKATPEELILVDWVWEKWRGGNFVDVVDKRLNNEFDEFEVVVVLKLGLMCSNNAPEGRPSMRQVIRYLEGEVALPEVVAAPDGRDRKMSGRVGCGGSTSGVEFEDFVHSYPSSSNFEKVSVCSSGNDGDGDGDGDDDIEVGSSSPLFGRSDCRNIAF